MLKVIFNIDLNKVLVLFINIMKKNRQKELFLEYTNYKINIIIIYLQSSKINILR